MCAGYHTRPARDQVDHCCSTMYSTNCISISIPVFFQEKCAQFSVHASMHGCSHFGICYSWNIVNKVCIGMVYEKNENAQGQS